MDESVGLGVEAPSLPYGFEEEASPLSLEKIAGSGQCFRWRMLGDGSAYVPAGGHQMVARQSGDLLEVRHDGPSDSFWREYLDLERDYASIERELAGASPAMEAAVRFGSGLRVLRQPLFETIVSYLISQNNNVANISRAIEALCGGERRPFPGPGGVEAALGAARIGYREGYVSEFCRGWESGEFDALEAMAPADAALVGRRLGEPASRAELDRARAFLQSRRGIGPKVASCIMLYALADASALPRDVWIGRAEDDYGIEWVEGIEGIQQLYVFHAIRHGALPRIG